MLGRGGWGWNRTETLGRGDEGEASRIKDSNTGGGSKERKRLMLHKSTMEEELKDGIYSG